MADEDFWFVSRHLGKVGIAHWKGMVLVAAFFVVAMTGLGVETALKRAHPILYVALMVPLGALALGLAWAIAARTKRD